jgi:hypothetical protein
MALGAGTTSRTRQAKTCSGSSVAAARRYSRRFAWAPPALAAPGSYREVGCQRELAAEERLAEPEADEALGEAVSRRLLAGAARGGARDRRPGERRDGQHPGGRQAALDPRRFEAVGGVRRQVALRGLPGDLLQRLGGEGEVGLVGQGLAEVFAGFVERKAHREGPGEERQERCVAGDGLFHLRRGDPDDHRVAPGDPGAVGLVEEADRERRLLEGEEALQGRRAELGGDPLRYLRHGCRGLAAVGDGGEDETVRDRQEVGPRAEIAAEGGEDRAQPGERRGQAGRGPRLPGHLSGQTETAGARREAERREPGLDLACSGAVHGGGGGNRPAHGAPAASPTSSGGRPRGSRARSADSSAASRARSP